MIVRKSRIPRRKYNALLVAFAKDKTAAMAASDCHVSINCANRYYRHFRECIIKSQRRAPRFFGEVEMDQAQFGGRGRKRMATLIKRYASTLSYREFKAKAAEIRKQTKVDVLGILQRDGHVYCQIIKKADNRTLAAIIRLVVEERTVVYTDKWRGFGDLNLDTYTHHTVNHSQSYSDGHGAHTNNIEAFWSFAKRRLAKFNGISKSTMLLHVKECEWRYNYGGDWEKTLTALRDLFALLESYENTPPIVPGSSVSIPTIRRPLSITTRPPAPPAPEPSRAAAKRRPRATSKRSSVPKAPMEDTQ